MKRVGLTMIQCGKCKHPKAMTMQGASWSITEFPSLVGVIRHPNLGIILFDAGYAPSFLKATKSLPEAIYRWTAPVTLNRGESAAEQLQDMGIHPNDVRHIVISHFHGDHVAGLADFPNAKLHCSLEGLKDMTARNRLSRIRRGMLLNLIPASITQANFFEHDKISNTPSELSAFPQGADVLGDGSLIAIPLPGHCPGHWGLSFRIEDGRTVLLAADAAWSVDAIESGTPPPTLTMKLLGNPPEQMETLGKLMSMASQKNLAILPSHCAKASKRAGLLR